MPMFEVSMRREQIATFYVEAPSKAEAGDAAEELSEDADWDEIDLDLQVVGVRAVPQGVRYWAGGPEGDWVNNV